MLLKNTGKKRIVKLTQNQILFLVLYGIIVIDRVLIESIRGGEIHDFKKETKLSEANL
jgi:hypothetical protein